MLRTRVVPVALAATALAAAGWAQAVPAAQAARGPAPHLDLLGRHCLACHSSAVRTAGLDLEAMSRSGVSDAIEAWEAVLRKLKGRQMPPAGVRRPGEAGYEAAISSLAVVLDRYWAANPNPGRPPTLRRMTRTEYRNAVRDILGVEVDVESLLPADEASHGFDNVTVGDLPPTLLERYVAAAEKISRLAIGRAGRIPDARTVRVRPDLTQEGHLPGLPIGTRGGVLVQHTFPVGGEYQITVRLARDRNEDIEGLSREHELELLVDRERVALFDVKPPPRDGDHRNADRHLSARVRVTAGPHEVGATFLKDPSVLLQTQRQPYQAHFNFYRHPRIQPAVYSVTIVGPYSSDGPGRTPSRERILACRPDNEADELPCARDIASTLAIRAFRRPVTDEEVDGALAFYQLERSEGGDFEAGIERAVAAILVSPQFLFRVEREPAGVTPGTPYRISGLELATRLASFLWSSVPDDELRAAAASGDLFKPAGLERQVLRMLADHRSETLVNHFASQWLHLRNLDSIRPDMRRFPDFDDNLRQAFRRETELLLGSVVREDRSVLDLLRTDHTFVNERLAKHYGIPNVYGTRFRRVDLGAGSMRGGLLRHGSVLTVTSYATRTSPVIRGKWILENILAMPPPPPPADVPELSEKTISGKLSVRERLAEHRADPACAGCHAPMDPLGFALENYDAVGRWRTEDDGEPVDASGELVDGTRIDGVAGLEDALLQRPELFVTAMAEKLLTFALGRGVEYYDAPAVRGIVRTAEASDFRFSSLILGITSSAPFQMRMSQ